MPIDIRRMSVTAGGVVAIVISTASATWWVSETRASDKDQLRQEHLADILSLRSDLSGRATKDDIDRLTAAIENLRMEIRGLREWRAARDGKPIGDR